MSGPLHLHEKQASKRERTAHKQEVWEDFFLVIT